MDRFWRKVDKSKSTLCWPWMGGRNKAGYGAFYFKGRQTCAHRFAYALTAGIDPFVDMRNKVVMHTCDNPSCCNPYHLRLGTQKQNIEDMYIKGRNNDPGAGPQHGERNNAAKLTEEMVTKIRILYGSGVSQREIARTLGVHHGNVWVVVHGKSWSHMDSCADDTSTPQLIADFAAGRI